MRLLKKQIVGKLTVCQLCFYYGFRSLKLHLGLLSEIFIFSSKTKSAGILEYKVSNILHNKNKCFPNDLHVYSNNSG